MHILQLFFNGKLAALEGASRLAINLFSKVESNLEKAQAYIQKEEQKNRDQRERLILEIEKLAQEDEVFLQMKQRNERILSKVRDILD